MLSRLYHWGPSATRFHKPKASLSALTSVGYLKLKSDSRRGKVRKIILTCSDLTIETVIVVVGGGGVGGMPTITMTVLILTWLFGVVKVRYCQLGQNLHIKSLGIFK